MIILNMDSGCYFGLNSVASSIWKLIDSSKTVKDMKDEIVAQYKLEPERAEQDILGLLQDLVSEELIEVTNETVA